TLAREFGFETAVVPRQAKQLSREAYDQRLVETIAPAAPDLIVLAGFMRVIGHEFIQHFNGNVINIHPSLLPKYQGLHVHQRVLDAGESESGCSVHYVSAEVDAGPLIAQAAVPVLGGDTADTLAARILETEHKLLPLVVRAIAAGTVSRSYLDGVDRTIFADGVEQLIPVKWICRPG
ncbi:MAG: phosphoribosylglycinamide formyltransferase, partial [Bdellovibrionales bacterium]|nr:phosphoribosylglycinamide formyltransferase [Bdellovibrionales bacterium]